MDEYGVLRRHARRACLVTLAVEIMIVHPSTLSAMGSLAVPVNESTRTAS